MGFRGLTERTPVPVGKTKKGLRKQILHMSVCEKVDVKASSRAAPQESSISLLSQHKSLGQEFFCLRTHEKQTEYDRHS